MKRKRKPIQCPNNSTRKFIAQITSGKNSGCFVDIVFHGCGPTPAEAPIEEVVKVGVEFWFCEDQITVTEFENGKPLRQPVP